MNILEFYNEVRNPLENTGLLKTMFMSYLKTSNFEEFYIKLIQSVEIKNFSMENEAFGVEASKKFSVLMFKLWRYNILNTPFDKIPFVKYNNDVNGYLNIKKALKDIEDIQFVGNSTKIKSDIELDLFSWFNFDDAWTYISSYNINVSQVLEMEKEHILYLNVNSLSDLYKILKLFIEQCIRFNLPYNFKYSNDINKDSTIVIYSDTKNLTNFVNILKNICQDGELRLTMSGPKLLSGTIDSYIGYESKVYSRDEDFTIERLKYIYEILDEVIPELYDVNFKIDKCDYKDVTYEDYIIGEIVRLLERKLEDENGNILDYKRLKSKVNTLRNTKFKDLSDIEIRVGLNNKITCSKSSIMDLIVSVLSSVFRKYPDYLDRVLEMIVLKSKEKGIDPKTFCFDLNTIEKIKDYDIMSRNGAIIIPEKHDFKLSIVAKNRNEKFGYYIGPNGKVYPTEEAYNKVKEKAKKNG